MKLSSSLRIIVTIALIILTSTSLFAVNTLTVQDPDIWGTKPGYIDKATLVVEPLGGYVQQSLYLTYSDHNQFTPGSKLEIVHRFELPEGSVITDMWLWIGDSVMQGVLMDTWTARSIYDSIVVVKRDPAFLTKNGNQYELHVYPLYPGSYRRVKITFITPTKWFGNIASAEAPLNFLLSNNSSAKPLEVFFKETRNVWGEPALLEIPDAHFEDFVDTLGYLYKYYKIDDLSTLPSLNITFQTDFSGGYFFGTYKKPGENSYFQIGLSPETFFNLSRDTSSHKYMIGIDISGAHDKDYSQLIPNIRNALKTALKSTDFFNIIISGAGEVKRFSNTWLQATPQAIDGVLNEFLSSDLADSINSTRLPVIVYCDGDATNGWQFPGIEDMAEIQNYPTIQQASNYFGQADVAATYQEGLEQALSVNSLNALLPSVDAFFQKGGRMITYFDYNRDGRELLASHYINGLRTLSVSHGAVKLYRNLSGNIGSYFPETVVHESSYFLAYNDSSVKVELTDQNGRPAIISKKINNGLLIVSGIWQLNDDGAMKTILDIPLLGLNSVSRYLQLKELLDTLSVAYNHDKFDKVILFSNSDSLYQKYDAAAWVNSYLQNFTSSRPAFTTINLLNGNGFIPPSLSDNGTDYFGSGYLEQMLSDSTNGLHLETHTNDWNYIASVISSNSAPLNESFSITQDSLLSGSTSLKSSRRPPLKRLS